MSEYYIVASSKPWHYAKFESTKADSSQHWIYVATPEELEQAVSSTLPRYVFFLHWNWLVPRQIWAKHECVCFHMTDVPYGRGGSPLQNLIERGHANTCLTALRMVEEMDAGPVYAKRLLSLEGRAEEIYLRAGDICWELIDWIVRTRPQPDEQQGDVTRFSRRKPDQSRLPESGDLRRIYDHIRMLDAPTYPLAFLKYGDFVLEFTHAELADGQLRASVTIRERLANED
jgi:methionyl-tRNA formyltransferase